MAAALHGALRRALRVAAHSSATCAPLAALPALEAAPLPLRHALGGSVRGFATRSRSPRDVSRALEALRRKREAAAGADEGEAPSSTTPQAPPPLSEDVQRAATAAGGSLTPHAATAVAFTPAALAPVFSRSALIITREIEWGTIVLGFEQANKYTIRDANGEVVAFIAEETASIASAIGRQLLRRRRPMTATVLSPAGDIIFRVRRPLYLINSTMNIEDASGEVVGEVLQRWHAWRRHYDVYIRKRQFAKVRSGLLAWEFLLEDEVGRPLAQIDRNFQGFGKELFTDTGMYVIHFGDALPGPEGLTADEEEEEEEESPARAPAAVARQAPVVPPPPASSDALVPGADPWQPPVPVRPLALSERAVCLALAIAVDFDFFSTHSNSNTGAMAGMMMPMPFPMGGGSGEAGAAAGAEADAAAGAAGESPAADEPPVAAPDWRQHENLGGDEPFKPDDQAPTWSDSPVDVDASDDDDGDDDDEGGGGGGWGLVRDIFNTVTGNDSDNN